MLSELQNLPHVDRALVSITKHHIEPANEYNQPIHYACYQAGPKMRDFENVEIGKTPSQEVIEPAQSSLAVRIVLDSKRDKALSSCTYYRKQNSFN